jgi:hypothetical protein
MNIFNNGLLTMSCMINVVSLILWGSTVLLLTNFLLLYEDYDFDVECLRSKRLIFRRKAH